MSIGIIFGAVFMVVALVFSAITGHFYPKYPRDKREGKRPDPYGLGLTSLTAAALSFACFWGDGQEGHLSSPKKLESKMIYQIKGRMKVVGKKNEVFALSNAIGNIIYVESSALHPDVEFVVRVKKSTGDYLIVPVYQEKTALPTDSNSVKPVSKGNGIFLLKNKPEKACFYTSITSSNFNSKMSGFTSLLCKEYHSQEHRSPHKNPHNRSWLLKNPLLNFLFLRNVFYNFIPIQIIFCIE